MSACGSSTFEAADVAALRERAHDRLRAVLRRRQIDLQAVVARAARPSPARRRTASRRRARAGRAVPASSRSMNASTAFALEKTIQSNVAGARARLVERAVVVGRHDADHRRFDRLGAHRLEQLDELGGLIARAASPARACRTAAARRTSAGARAAPTTRPTTRIAGRRSVGSARRSRRSRSSVPAMRLLRRQRAVVDDRRRRRPAGRPCESSAVSICGSCCGPA